MKSNGAIPPDNQAPSEVMPFLFLLRFVLTNISDGTDAAYTIHAIGILARNEKRRVLDSS